MTKLTLDATSRRGHTYKKADLLRLVRKRDVGCFVRVTSAFLGGVL